MHIYERRRPRPPPTIHPESTPRAGIHPAGRPVTGTAKDNYSAAIYRRRMIFISEGVCRVGHVDLPNFNLCRVRRDADPTR